MQCSLHVWKIRSGKKSKSGKEDVRRRLVSQETRSAKTDVKTRGCRSEGSEKRIQTVVISAQGVVLLLSVPLDIETLETRKLISSDLSCAF